MGDGSIRTKLDPWTDHITLTKEEPDAWFGIELTLTTTRARRLATRLNKLCDEAADRRKATRKVRGGRDG